MGGAVSSISNAVTSGISSVGGFAQNAGGLFGGSFNGLSSGTNAFFQNPLGSIGSGIGNILGDTSGAALGGLIKGIVPDVPIADQSKLQGQISNQQGMANQFTGQQQQQQGIANQQVANAQGMITGQSQNAINQAQNVNQGGNVQSSIGLLGQTAAGGGAAQQAAAAQLQRGTDQAINTQLAMANSGNLSQMIGGQRNAMANAAQLQQQNALNAASLQAGMAGNAQGQFAGAAGQQASQAAQNAGLQQTQAQQQANLAALSSGQAQGYAGQANTAQGNAMTGQTNALGIQQQALGQTAQYRAQALGGMLNAGGGAAAAMASDENLKYDINYAGNPNKPKVMNQYSAEGMLSSDEDSKEHVKHEISEIKSFLDAIDPVSFKYKQPDGQNGKTEGVHLGVIAQQIEKAPGGKSMVMDTPKGKAIDIPSAVGTLLASVADTNSRLNDLEELFKSRSESRKKK